METSVSMLERIVNAPTDDDWRRLDNLPATRNKP